MRCVSAIAEKSIGHRGIETGVRGPTALLSKLILVGDFGQAGLRSRPESDGDLLLCASSAWCLICWCVRFYMFERKELVSK